jgi:hypothetical protein
VCVHAQDDKMLVSLANTHGAPTTFSRDIALIWCAWPVVSSVCTAHARAALRTDRAKHLGARTAARGT